MESAYNIVKLAMNPRVYQYGYENVSMRMPANLLTEFTKYGCHIDLKDVDKSFFDKMTSFVPLETRWSPYKGGYSKITKGEDAFFWDERPRMVVIPIQTSQAARTRYSHAIERERMRVVYHEYGHVYDFDKFVCISKDFDKLYKKFFGISDEKFDAMRKMFVDKITLNETNREAMGQASDIIQALRKDAENSAITNGHFDGYYNIDVSRRREIVANATAMRYLGNDMLKMLYPELYDELMKLVVAEYN